ncbi:hypothetical protein H5410_052181 [Solanum commersonii]|uniref:Uncharacterized protein n=1 Tax=Solanum commersonii TaxID=4109 RepID=A0A9J5X0P8_SOLCO|nr:hypothetical protein H5410_052181 [Solanum commersonii]
MSLGSRQNFDASGVHCRLLARLDSAPLCGILLASGGSPITVCATPLVHGHSVGFHTPNSSSVPSMAPSRFASPFFSASATMSIAEQKSFERFVRLVPPRFDGSQATRYMPPSVARGILEGARSGTKGEAQRARGSAHGGS